VSENKEPELTPEQEKLVASFRNSLNADGSEGPVIPTPAGLVPVTEDHVKRVQEAATQHLIDQIRKPQPSLAGKIIRDVSGICFGVLAVAGTSYVVHAAVRAIIGG
jgi:hypothetical protein